MSSKKVLRARPDTSQLALAALNNVQLWPDLMPKTGRGKPVSMAVQDKCRAEQAERVNAVKQSMRLAQFDEVTA